jgi:hypothetical protein
LDRAEFRKTSNDRWHKYLDDPPHAPAVEEARGLIHSGFRVKATFQIKWWIPIPIDGMETNTFSTTSIDWWKSTRMEIDWYFFLNQFMNSSRFRLSESSTRGGIARDETTYSLVNTISRSFSPILAVSMNVGYICEWADPNSNAFKCNSKNE